MFLPRFFIDQKVKLVDHNNRIMEGIVQSENGIKYIFAETKEKIPFDQIKTIQYNGRRLDEDAKDVIDKASEKIDWKKAATDPDQEKISEEFGKLAVQMSGDKKNEKEIMELGKSAAEGKLMQARIENGTSSETKEIAKYMDKNDLKSESLIIKQKERIENMRMQAYKKYLNESDTSDYGVDYGDDNIYPTENKIMDQDVDHTLITKSNLNMAGDEFDSVDKSDLDEIDSIINDNNTIKQDSVISKDPIESSVDDDINDLINNTDEANKMPMTTDLEITNGEEISSSGADYTSDLAEIDDILNDSKSSTSNISLDMDGNSESEFDSLKNTLQSKYDVPPTEANDLIRSIKGDISNAVSHVVKDTLSTVVNNVNKPTNEGPIIADSVTQPSLENEVDYSDPMSIKDPLDTVSVEDITSEADVYSNDEPNDEVDQAIENAIDEYDNTSGENYSEEELFEFICNKFNVKNSSRILESCDNCVPDAILTVSKLLKK